MGLPSDNKNQVNRTREEPDPAAASPKPILDKNRKGGLRGQDKRQGDLRQANLEQGHHQPGVNMPKPPKPMNELDQSKAGLQDDHDPRDPRRSRICPKT